MRKEIDKARDAELEAKGKDAIRDFDDSQALFVPAKKRVSKLISIRLPMGMIKELRDVASKKGDIGYQQLIKIFIADGLLKSQFENSSFASVCWPQARFGEWKNLGNSSSYLEELSTLSELRYGRSGVIAKMEERSKVRCRWTSRF